MVSVSSMCNRADMQCSQEGSKAKNELILWWWSLHIEINQLTFSANELAGFYMFKI